MPNGDDKNWVRICSAVDGFRGRFGCWPTGVRLPPIYFENVVGHVLSPAGFALVSSIFAIISDDDLSEMMAIIAVGKPGAEFRYGESDDTVPEEKTCTAAYFGHAVLRHGLDGGLDYVTLEDSEGNVIWTGKGVQAKVAPENETKIRNRPRKGTKNAKTK